MSEAVEDAATATKKNLENLAQEAQTKPAPAEPVQDEKQVTEQSASDTPETQAQEKDTAKEQPEAAPAPAEPAKEEKQDTSDQNPAPAEPDAELPTDAAELAKQLKELQTDKAEKEAQPEPSAEAQAPPVEGDNTPTEAQTAPATQTAPTASVTPPANDKAADAPVDEAAAAKRKAERQEARRAERQAEREAAREAMEQEPAGEVITEEVTDDDTRKSDEDFATSVIGDAKAKDDDGLSNLEKALLLGLGAAVVGTVLKNGDKVVSNSGDRIVVQDEGGDLRVLKDDEALLRRPGDAVKTERFSDGSTRQTVEKNDGSRIITVQGSDGTVLRRISVNANGDETILFDDLAEEREVVVTELPPVVERSFAAQERSEAELRTALIAEQDRDQARSFSLRQVREISEVRALAAPIELDAARFATGSAAIAPEQARSLARVGNTLRDLIADDPRTVFLIEGHTDAVGDATYNLALSDRRAETVALALTEYFDVPPENLVTQGYGESALKVQTTSAEQANRRAVVRNITNLLRSTSN